MNYFDPERPKIGDRPALLWNGEPIPGVIPGVCFTPLEDGVWSLEVFIIIASATGRWLRSYSFLPTEEMLQAYLDNPEEVLQEHFGWTYNAEARKRSLSLEDLGELE